MKISEIEVGCEYAVRDDTLSSGGKALRATVLETRGSRESVYPTAEGERTELRQGIVVELAEPPEVPVYDIYLADGKRFRPGHGARQVASRPLREAVLKNGACVLMRWEDYLLVQERERRAQQERQRAEREHAEALIADAAGKAAAVTRMLDAFYQQGWTIDSGTDPRSGPAQAQLVFPAAGIGGREDDHRWSDHRFPYEIQVWSDASQKSPPDLTLYLRWARVAAAEQPGVTFALESAQIRFSATQESALAVGLVATSAAHAAEQPAPNPAPKQAQ